MTKTGGISNSIRDASRMPEIASPQNTTPKMIPKTVKTIQTTRWNHPME